MEKISPSTKLRQVAQLRIQQLFGSALTETGESLPPTVRDGISRIINGPHKTFRYMLVTGLLVAVSDSRLNPRCLQMNAGCEGAYDARSLCQKVIVPFEKTYLQGRLGASNEPFANKTARADMIDERIHVRKGRDTILLETICEVLELVRQGDSALRKTAFVYALSVILKRPANSATVLETGPIESSGLDANSFFSFFEAHTKGVAAVAVLAAFFRMFYEKGTKVKVHPVTESGASSREVGDIDLEFNDGRCYAVEVKDKTFTDVDVSHACEKALAAGVRKVIFAVGHSAEKAKVSRAALVDCWADRGLELSFLTIADSLGVALVISDEGGRREFATNIYESLVEMNAPDEIRELFKKAFQETVT